MFAATMESTLAASARLDPGGTRAGSTTGPGGPPNSSATISLYVAKAMAKPPEESGAVKRFDGTPEDYYRRQWRKWAKEPRWDELQ